MVAAYTSLGRRGFTATAAASLGPLAADLHVTPASALRKIPSRIATYMTRGFEEWTAKPLTVLVGRPPTLFQPQKQSGLRVSPSAVPA